jgi:hypothetical protein
MMNLILWFLLLVLQNAAFTWVSRARNSGSIGYHAIAAVFSNGIWFVSQFLLISMVAKPGMPLEEITLYGIVYVLGTVIGSLLMHWISMRYMESGNRKVGA